MCQKDAGFIINTRHHHTGRDKRVRHREREWKEEFNRGHVMEHKYKCHRASSERRRGRACLRL